MPITKVVTGPQLAVMDDPAFGQAVQDDGNVDARAADTRLAPADVGIDGDALHKIGVGHDTPPLRWCRRRWSNSRFLDRQYTAPAGRGRRATGAGIWTCGAGTRVRFEPAFPHDGVVGDEAEAGPAPTYVAHGGATLQVGEIARDGDHALAEGLEAAVAEGVDRGRGLAEALGDLGDRDVFQEAQADDGTLVVVEACEA